MNLLKKSTVHGWLAHRTFYSYLGAKVAVDNVFIAALERAYPSLKVIRENLGWKSSLPEQVDF
jgi:hypothetical protein